MAVTREQVVTLLRGLAGVAVLLPAGFLIGLAYQETWGLTSTILAGVLALLAVVFLFSLRQDVRDGDPMPETQRRFLALYLVSICVGLVYLVFALMSVRFPDLEASALPTAPILPESARPTGVVGIAHVVPNPIRSDLAPLDLQIFGYNFTAPLKSDTPAQPDPAASGTPARGAAPEGAAVTPPRGPEVVFGNTTKIPKFVSDHLVIVSLSPDDVAQPGIVTLTVNGRFHPPATATVRVLDVTGELRVLRWRRQITREMQLLLLVIVAGGLGSYVHAIRSLSSYIGNQQAVASWFWFYITKPFLGMALAIVFYAAIRGGFVAGSPADVKSVNPFGVFAIAALVGMFADKAGNKLAEIFDALFKSTSERQNPISNLSIATAALPDATVNTAYTAKIVVTGGTPPYTFSLITHPSWLTVDPATGVLSGTPTAAGEETVEATVADAKTSRTSRKYTLKVIT